MPLVPHVASGQIIASNWGNNVADQVVMRFTTAAQRTTQLPAPNLGQLTSRDDAPGVIEWWTGTAWAPVGGVRELAYAQITTPKTIAQGAEAVADAIVSAPAITVDGSTAILVEVFAPIVAPAAVAGGTVSLYLFQDGASVGRIGSVGTPAAGALYTPVYGYRRLTPAAGSRTFVWGGVQAGGNGTVHAGPGGVGQLVPAFIRITRAA